MLIHADCFEWMEDQPDDSVDFVFGSPEYVCKGERYGPGTKWDVESWIDMMLGVTREAVRVSKGYVLWVANGAVRKGVYQPACEGLIYQAFTAGLTCERPVIWHKNAPPNRRDWFGNDWEFVLAFKKGKPYFNWEAVAEPPKFTSGGDFRQRDTNGTRRRGGSYPKNELARPRDVVRVTVGGGHMGHELAHENEAPFPVKLAEHFINVCCPPGGTVLDPFAGSGTTGQAARELGREYILIDRRESQIDLMKRRLSA